MIRPDLAQQRLRSTIAGIRDRTFRYAPRSPRRRNWHLYDLAQAHELEEILGLIDSLVTTFERESPVSPSMPVRPGGRPPVPVSDLLRVLLWQSYRTLANRPTEGDLRVLTLGLSRRFSYKTVERAYSHPRVVAALPRLLDLTNRPLRGLETVFSVDGSGFPGAVGDHYRSERARQNGSEREGGYLPKGPRSWVRNVANVGVRFGLIAGWQSWTDEHLGETHCFEGVLAQTWANHPEMKRQLGDGAYAGRPQVAVADRYGVECRFLPRRACILHSYGVRGWRPSLWGLVVNPQGWLAEYHLRSVSESVWSALKGRQPRRILKRREVRRVTEATLRAITYNLRRLAYLRWTERDTRFTALAA